MPHSKFLFLRNISFFISIYLSMFTYLQAQLIPLQYTNFLVFFEFHFCLLTDWNYTLSFNLCLLKIDYKKIEMFHKIHSFFILIDFIINSTHPNYYRYPNHDLSKLMNHQLFIQSIHYLLYRLLNQRSNQNYYYYIINFLWDFFLNLPYQIVYQWMNHIIKLYEDVWFFSSFQLHLQLLDNALLKYFHSFLLPSKLLPYVMFILMFYQNIFDMLYKLFLRNLALIYFLFRNHQDYNCYCYMHFKHCHCYLLCYDCNYVKYLN